MDDDFKRLFADVRKHRSGMDIKITPSAREDVDLLAVAEKLIRENFLSNSVENNAISSQLIIINGGTAKQKFFRL